MAELAVRKESMFRGFFIEFRNGYRVSVQFGEGAYCNNYTSAQDSCPNAEIAAWNTHDNDAWYRPEGWDDAVKGYCTPDEVLAFMNEVANL